MTLNKENTIVAKRIVQNNQEFLLGTFKIRQIKNFTKYTQHLIVDYEEVEGGDKIYSDQVQLKPNYKPEVQRKLNNSKVEKIADYLISDKNAMFPTNIVIAIPSEVIDDFEENNNDIVITLNPIVKHELEKSDGTVFLTIIDGQHRIRGIERAIERLDSKIDSLIKVLNTSDNKKLSEELDSNKKLLDRLLNFELLVTFFIDPSLEYQAMIFSTINKTQTKVPENLVFSLFGLTNNDSPQKTSLEVVLALNGIEKSPFYNRIKLVGGNYKKGKMVPLSQATMVKSILYNISNNAREAEVDRTKSRTHLKSNPKNLPFRNYYASNKDHMIVRILYSFFGAVRNTFRDPHGQSYWEFKEGTKVLNVLQTNVGYQALLKVLIYLLKKVPEDKKDDRATYESYLTRAKDIDWEDSGEQKRYPFTSASVKVLYNDIMLRIFPGEFKLNN